MRVEGPVVVAYMSSFQSLSELSIVMCRKRRGGIHLSAHLGLSESRGTYWGPYDKGILLFGDLYRGSLIFVDHLFARLFFLAALLELSQVSRVRTPCVAALGAVLVARHGSRQADGHDFGTEVSSVRLVVKEMKRPD